MARSLGSAGHLVDLGFPIGSRFFAAYSRYCKKCLIYPDPSYAEADFLKFFSQLAGSYDFIMPTMEKTQLPLSLIKDDLESAGTVVPIPSNRLLNVAVDKIKMLKVAKENGIPAPQTLVLTQEPEIDFVMDEVGTPFIMKTSTEQNIPPGPGHRYIVVKNRLSEKQFAEKFVKLSAYGPVILQQYVTGVGLGASYIFSKDHKLLAFFGHRRILERFSEGGPSVIAETYFDQKVAKLGFTLLSALKWQGVAMTEFKMSKDGTVYFMEINPRFWGTLPLAIASGIDFPKLLIDNYCHPSRAREISRAKNRIMVNSLMIPPMLKRSLVVNNLSLTKEILKSSLKALKYGAPFIVELEKYDIIPEILNDVDRLKYHLTKNSISRVGNIFFGPKASPGALTKLGIKSVLDLREEFEKESNEEAVQTKMVNFPIKDDTAPNLASLLSLVSIIEQFVSIGPVYIHCKLGHGRAPTAVIAYLLSTGISLNMAYSLVYKARSYAHPNLVQRAALYTLYQHLQKQERCGS